MSIASNCRTPSLPWCAQPVCAAVVTIAAFLSNLAAAETIFSDRSAFESTSPDLITNTLDSLVGTLAYPQNYPAGPGYATNSPLGITVDGVRYVGSGSFGWETYILGPGVATEFYSLNGTFALVGGRTITDIFLPRGVTAFGTDFGFDRRGADGGSLTLTVFLRDGTTETEILTVAPHSISRGQFFGYIGSVVERIWIDSGQTGFFPYTLLDNVSFGPTAVVEPVPEPGGLAMCSIFAVLVYGGRVLFRWPAAR